MCDDLLRLTPQFYLRIGVLVLELCLQYGGIRRRVCIHVVRRRVCIHEVSATGISEMASLMSSA